MRLVWVVFYLMAAREPAPEPKPIDFKRDVQPILERRCTPCHFRGGKMHDELPFDQAATIHKLGEKLFTRIKAEDERNTIRAYLKQLP